ncbi:MAG: hypothetical protein B6244_08875 [Candidatus Cloacimonetes bacterium 4572_55]|nr:MAG: hypothetical protein B6244_08875 [Candidatus Cloacimonetes bacterium 4572_55]
MTISKRFFWSFLALIFGIILICQSEALSQGDSFQEELFSDGTTFEEMIYSDTDPIILTATKTEKKVSEAPSIVSVITAKDIQNMGARSLNDALRRVVGIDMVMESIMQMPNFVFRGLRSRNKYKFLLNGTDLPITNFSSPGPFIASIPVDNIRQIEVIRGPGSALYGTGAFLGVVNILTWEGAKEKKNTEKVKTPSLISFRGENFHTYHPAVAFSYYKSDITSIPLYKNDLQIRVFGEHLASDGPEMHVERDAFGFSGKTTYDMESYSFFSNASYKNFSFQTMFIDLEGSCPIGVANNLTDDNEVSVTTYMGELAYKRPFLDDFSNEKGNVAVRASYSHYLTEPIYEVFSEDAATGMFGFPEGEKMLGNPYLTLSRFIGDVSVSYKFELGIEAVCGALYEYQKQYDVGQAATFNATSAPITLDDGVSYNPMESFGRMVDFSHIRNHNVDTTRTITTGYAQTTFDIKKLANIETFNSLALTGGIRYDDYNDVGSTLNPRVGLVISLIEQVYFKTLYGEAFRAPSFEELYNRNNPAATGNPNLDPETVTTIEGMVGVDFGIGEGSISYFDVQIKDHIDWVNGLATNYGKFASRGVEFEAKARFLEDRLSGFVNLTYQDVENRTNQTITSLDTLGNVTATYTQEDFRPGGSPEIIANLGMNFVYDAHMNANTWVNYVGERKRSQEKKFENGNLVVADQRDNMDARFLVNVSMSFQNFDFAPSLKLQFSGYNILDEDYRDPELTGDIEKDLPREGASFMTKLTYEF